MELKIAKSWMWGSMQSTILTWPALIFSGTHVYIHYWRQKTELHWHLLWNSKVIFFDYLVLICVLKWRVCKLGGLRTRKLSLGVGSWWLEVVRITVCSVAPKPVLLYSFYRNTGKGKDWKDVEKKQLFSETKGSLKTKMNRLDELQ